MTVTVPRLTKGEIDVALKGRTREDLDRELQNLFGELSGSDESGRDESRRSGESRSPPESPSSIPEGFRKLLIGDYVLPFFLAHLHIFYNLILTDEDVEEEVGSGEGAASREEKEEQEKGGSGGRSFETETIFDDGEGVRIVLTEAGQPITLGK